jgi:hypothetical protein
MVLHPTYEVWDLWQVARHSAHDQQSKPQRKSVTETPKEQLYSNICHVLTGKPLWLLLRKTETMSTTLETRGRHTTWHKPQKIGYVRIWSYTDTRYSYYFHINGIKVFRTFWFLQASLALMFLITCLGLESSKGIPFNRACSSYSPSLKKSPTAYIKRGQKEHTNIVFNKESTFVPLRSEEQAW